MARRSDDVIGFTRIFVLFVTLVIVPSLFMSGFGVIAIANVSQAEKQRQREQAMALRKTAEASLVAALEAGDRAVYVDDGADAIDVDAVFATARAAGGAVGAGIVFVDGAVAGAQDPFTQPTLAAQIRTLAGTVPDGKAAHVAVDVDDFGGVVSMQRNRDARGRERMIAYVVDDEVLRRRLPPPTDGMRVSLRVDVRKDEPVQNALDRLITEPVVVQELVAHRLDVPFDRFTLVVDAPPTETTAIVVVYIVLLAIFLITLIVGVVITARLIYQETRLSRLKTDFVSHMGHELRTPLTSIRLFIETLKLGRAQSKEEEQECLDLLAKETERLSEMIERVLGYARLRAGRRVFKEESIDIQEIVDDALDAFRAHTLPSSSAGAGLQLTTAITPGLPHVIVDRESMVEALLNLIGNAFKYTGPEKKIAVFARPGKRGRVVVGVVDNGPGLPKAEHARIFERFYQARSLLTGKAAGSGLGLAITKAIVEGQGGKIGVESEPGAGSTFFIDLRASPPG